MKTCNSSSPTRHKTLHLAAILIAFALFAGTICFSNACSEPAFAVSKTEVVTGEISMVLAKPTTPTEQVTAGKDKSSSTNQLSQSSVSDSQKAAEPATINKILAQTGDYLPYILLALAIACVSFAGITCIARRNTTGKEVFIKTVVNLSVAKKAGIIILATILLSAISITVKQAIADEKSDPTANTNYIAKASGRIEVGLNGEIKSSSIDISNLCRSNLKIGKIHCDGDFSKFINGQIKTGDIVLPGKNKIQAWVPQIKRIDSSLLDRLKKNSGKLTEEIKVEVSREFYSVRYAMNDKTGVVFSEQEIAHNENATIPIHQPSYKRHTFVGWNTREDGEGEVVDENYLLKHAITANVTFYAKWKPFVGSEAFLAKASSIKVMPCEIFTGEEQGEEIIPIEDVLKAADRIRRGDNPDPDVYNDTNDKWHLFTKIGGNGEKISDWMESRIIHIGEHDGDKSAITFQSVYAMDEKVAFDTNHKKSYAKFYGDWNISTLKERLNSKFFDKIPASLRNSIHMTQKKTNRAAGVTPNGGGVYEGLQKIWLISYTELVGRAGEKSGKWTDSNHDGSVYNFWKRKNWFPYEAGKSLYVDPYQKSYISQMCTTRDERNKKTVSELKDRACWMRSLSPSVNTNALAYDARGIIDSDEGRSVDTELFVNPCFAI